MKPDVSGNPTIAETGPVQFMVIERGDRVGVRVRDREHPARTSFRGLDYFPTDRKWRVEARLEKYDPPKQIPILNVVGIVQPLPSPGALVFSIDGKEYRLDPIVEEGDEELFRLQPGVQPAVRLHRVRDLPAAAATEQAAGADRGRGEGVPPVDRGSRIAECRMQNAECRMQNAECRMQKSMDPDPFLNSEF
jgi:hypothetical protein